MKCYYDDYLVCTAYDKRVNCNKDWIINKRCRRVFFSSLSHHKIKIKTEEKCVVEDRKREGTINNDEDDEDNDAT